MGTSIALEVCFSGTLCYLTSDGISSPPEDDFTDVLDKITDCLSGMSEIIDPLVWGQAPKW